VPAHVREAIDSATVRQELAPSQFVLVRDGPVGAALQELIDECKARPGMSVVELEQNRGLARALNVGLQAAEHGIVARCDADDICLPERFATQVPLVAGGADVVGSSMIEFDTDPGAVAAVRRMPVSSAEIAHYARLQNPVAHPTAVYRRELVEQVGGYEHLPFMEDYLLWARLLMAGAKLVNVAQPLVAYRTGRGAYARRGSRAAWRSEMVLQRMFLSMGFTTRKQFVRNLFVRGAFYALPTGLARSGFRALLRRRDRLRGGGAR
jgi:glycosyltransferase involved in cell wall biosynthesis